MANFRISASKSVSNPDTLLGTGYMIIRLVSKAQQGMETATTEG
ncbi:MAG TPA: hypothetical protein VK436_08415 [Methanocella sp.]|nr:hypothetical protein [Methanocella sp.]